MDSSRTFSEDRRRLAFTEVFWIDIRYAFRTLFRRPNFLVGAVIPLALGIGATTALFSVVYSILIDPFPFQGADRIVNSFSVDKAGAPRGLYLTSQQFAQFEKADVLEGAVAIDQWNTTVTDGDLPESVDVTYYSANGLSFLGVPPLIGRIFTTSDGPVGEAPAHVVVLTHSFWLSRYGGRPDVVGQKMELNGESYSIVGVIPERFDSSFGDIILPLHMKPGPNFAWAVYARLKTGISRQQAEEQLAPLLAQFAKESPRRFPAGSRIHFSTLLDQRRNGAFVSTLVLLFVAAALLMIVACANVSILLLAQGASRQSELALRYSIGAHRGRLLRQLMTESLLLGIIGASLGLLFAYWTLPMILRRLPPGALPIAPPDIQLNMPVLLLSATAALVTAVLFGLWPGMSFSRGAVSSILTSASGRIGGNLQTRRAHNVLIATQVALTVVLLVGTGAAIRTLLALYRTELRYDPSSVLVATANLSEGKYGQWSERTAFYERLRAQIGAIPGVESVGFSVYTGIPPRFGERFPVEIEGADTVSDFTRVVRISPEYLSTLKIPIVKGTVWSSAETATAPHVAVVNQTMAKRFWPNQDPVGKRVKIANFAAAASQFVVASPGSNGIFEIIGVAADVPNAGLRDPVAPSMYVPYSLMVGDSATFVTRTRGNPTSLVRAIREQVKAVDAHQALTAVRTAQTQLINQGWSRELFLTTILLAFGVFTLVVAALGLYSIVAYSVSRRLKEFGIRMALGASRGSVIRVASAPTMISIVIGLGIGLVVSIFATRVLEFWSITNSGGPIVFLVSSAVLLIVMVPASVIPAIRGTGIAPTKALRTE
jgi:predicted permease